MEQQQTSKTAGKGEALLCLQNIYRRFSTGDSSVTVLKNINLTIKRGEMVAIIGASGSGKSTLMNILGCLDSPSAGSYSIDGRIVGTLSGDALSALRRHYFGFIFQRYHLLGALTALGNAEMPAIYAGMPPRARRQRAETLLTRLGMSDRIHHRPAQLSGGQQQRVSIARALMNEAEIILADEPTGALDKHSGAEVLAILAELHAAGRTVILVTHDRTIAEQAERIIEISDGEILSDCPNQMRIRSAPLQAAPPMPQQKTEPAPLQIRQQHEIARTQIAPTQIACTQQESALQQTDKQAEQPITQAGSQTPPRAQKLHTPAPRLWDSLLNAQIMALLAMNAHKMRTFLTMLGVIIGIASVIAVVALGNGTQRKIIAGINKLGTNTLTIFAGNSMADVRSAKVTTLVEADAEALKTLPYADAVTPMVSASTTVHYGAINANASLTGVGEQFFAAQGAEILQGRLFDSSDVRTRALSLVIEKEAAKTLFPHNESPIGKIVLVGGVAAEIIGTVDMPQYGPGSGVLSLYLPYTTVQTRFIGNTILRSVTVLLNQNIDAHFAETHLTRFLTMRHGGKQDFFIRNSQDFMDEVISVTNALKLLIASIAFIALFVGGIGVMNIMLVTVSERINEIGVRMAVGARKADILRQFLIEAVLVCVVGGILGIALGVALGMIFNTFATAFKMVYSAATILTAFGVSTLIGISFGYLPARNASRLDPVSALSRD